MQKDFIRIASVCAFLAACGGGGGNGRPATPPAATCDSSTEYCGRIPATADACADVQYWPLRTASALHPITVHYSQTIDAQKASEIVALLDESWSVQIDTLGFSAPLDDQAQCGPDGNFDVFIWRGIDGAFVADVADNPATPHDDQSTFMAIDISGQTGGPLLDTYVAHEFNHALQASDDWWETAPHYESGATFAEALVYPAQDDYVFTLEDFQDNPQWSLFFDDSYATWYMYGAAMYLHFLHERYFTNDPGFYARIWAQTRSLPRRQRPDYIDALRTVLLNERGVFLDDSVLEFSQWRWFVGAYDDGAHFTNGGRWPHSVAFTDIDVASLPPTQALSAMSYGANYLRLSNGGSTAVDVDVQLQQNDAEVNWNILQVDAGAVAGPLTVPAFGATVIVAVVLPAGEVWTETLSFADRSAELLLSIVP